MIKSWVIGLRHFPLADGKVAPLPPRAQGLFAYLTEIVSRATQYDDPTTLRCRRRPERKPCGALFTISFDLDNNDVLCFCPRSHDEGRIAGWEGTFSDNGDMAERPSWGTIVELDTDKIDQAVLAPLSLGRHGRYRVWKGFNWAVMNQLHEKGYINDPVGKAHSVLLAEEGARESERLLRELFGRPRGGK